MSTTVFGAHAYEIKHINATKREITHLVSNARPDRAGDIVEPKGWVLDNYLRNPVVLVDHDYRVEKIIGRAASVYFDDSGLYATTKFHDKGLGAEAFELVHAGIAKAWSVGFKPTQQEPIKGEKGALLGFRFTQQELLEYSLVAIPMNPDAVNNAIRCGLSPDNIPILFSAPTDPAVAALDGANGTRRCTWQSATELMAKIARDMELRRRAEEMK